MIANDGEDLVCTAYTSDGAPYDKLIIRKEEDGIKRVMANENTAPPERSMSDTLPYKSPNF